jgi:hypothetical protein
MEVFRPLSHGSSWTLVMEVRGCFSPISHGSTCRMPVSHESGCFSSNIYESTLLVMEAYLCFLALFVHQECVCSLNM